MDRQGKILFDPGMVLVRLSGIEDARNRASGPVTKERALKATDRTAFEDHLDQLGVSSGRNLVVHGRLVAFGRCQPEDAFHSLRDRIGATATLVAPTYVFGASDPYDPAQSQPTGMGALSQMVWTHPGARRSLCPVHSHAGIGPLAHGLAETTMLSSFGAGTDFEWMHEQDFDLLLLGCTFGQAATFLHHLETLAHVPYRTWVDSPKDIVRAGRTETVPFRYYARSDAKVVEDFDRILPVLGDAARVVPAPYGSSALVSLRDLQRVGLDFLRADPYGLVQRVD